MKILGRIIWWDEKYKRGALESADGREFLFDASCVSGPAIDRRAIGKLVTFQADKKITNAPVAKQVTRISSRNLKPNQEKLLRALRDAAA